MSEGYIDLVDEQLRNSKTIAVVGLSNNPERDSSDTTGYHGICKARATVSSR